MFRGLVLRGATPARDALLAALIADVSDRLPCRRMPGHIDDERLLGGIDIAASLAAGKPVETRGLLAEAEGGVLIVPMAERLEDAIAGRLAQALDDGRVGVILLDDAIEAEDAPPVSLLERSAFHCDLSASREWAELTLPPSPTQVSGGVSEGVSEADMQALAVGAAALGVGSVRALIHAVQTASHHAGLNGRHVPDQSDLEAAMRLVLAPRATQIPPPPDTSEQEQEPPPPPPPPDNADTSSDSETPTPDQLQDLLVEAAAAAIPPDLLEQLINGNAPKRGASGTGKRRKSGLRGKPLGARPGMPRGGARLALIDTLRAAVPWQAVRRREAGIQAAQEARGGAPVAPNTGDPPILMRKDDLRVRRFEEKAARVTIFAVDASGSAAAARLAEAKGAVELMLAQAYVTRSEVALIAFRGESAELILPATRSLTRARRALAGLPGGGGTPLAMGLNAARDAAHATITKGRSPSLVVLTDGRANLDANGQPGRKQAGDDAQNAAKAIARSGIDALVVDISPRPGHEGPALASAMQARYLALPRADAKALHRAIAQTAPGPQ